MLGKDSNMWLGPFSMLVLVLTSCSPAALPTFEPTAKPAPETNAGVFTPTVRPALPSVSPLPVKAEPRKGGVLRLVTPGDPRSYDLHTDSGRAVITAVGPGYDGLVEYDDEEASKMVPGLAEKWESSADGRVFTFHLRNGVTWHDGNGFTAGDAEYSLKRILQKGVYLKEPLAFVEKVEAVADNVLTVALQQPRAVFMTVLADSWAAIMPKHIIEAKGNMERTLVGTGPFKFKSHYVGGAMELVRNADYFFKGRPYLDGITLYPIRDVATAQAAFRAKRVDFAVNLTMTTSGFLTLKAEEPDARVESFRGTGWWNFVMPVDKAPWDDIRVRRAVYLGLDRDAFVKVIERGAGAIGSFVPPIMGGPTVDELRSKPGYRQPKDADRAEAKKLLAEAGYASGFSTRILHRTGEPYQSAAVLLKSELATLGISAELNPRTEADLFELAYRGDYHSFQVRSSWKVPDPDGLLPLNYRSSAARNYSRLVDRETDGLIDEQSRTMDVVKRKEILREIDRRMTENIPAVTTHWFDYMYAWWRTTVHFVPPLTSTSNVRFAGAWLTK